MGNYPAASSAQWGQRGETAAFVKVNSETWQNVNLQVTFKFQT